jgi:hypothetical protein
MFDLVDLVKASREAADVDVSSLADDDLLPGAVELEAVLSAVGVAQAKVLGEIAIRRLTDHRYGQPVARWVAAEARVDRGGVQRRLKLGHHLRRLPAAEQAVVAGDLSADHAAVLAHHASNPRVGDQVEATQTLWVERAATTSFVDWKHQLECTVAQLDQDGGYDPNRDLARNTLRLTPFPSGSVGIAGELVGEQALVVRQNVEAHADRLYHRLKRDHDLCPELPLPNRSTLLAMALAELVSRGAAVDPERSTGPVTDVTLVIEATRTDLAAGSPAGRWGAAPTDGATNLETVASPRRGPLVLPPPAQPTDPPGAGNHNPRGGPGERVDLFDPYSAVERDGRVGLMSKCGPAHTPDGYPVHPEIAASLLCDPTITALIADSLGVALDMGRQVRYANREQRRALAHRDGGCVFPGCDAPVGWCDAHHVVPWDNGGHTDLDNLALLCRYHHGVSHRAGWTMTALPDQTFQWHTPLGQTLHSQRHRGRSPTGHPT